MSYKFCSKKSHCSLEPRKNPLNMPTRSRMWANSAVWLVRCLRAHKHKHISLQARWHTFGAQKIQEVSSIFPDPLHDILPDRIKTYGSGIIRK